MKVNLNTGQIPLIKITGIRGRATSNHSSGHNSEVTLSSKVSPTLFDKFLRVVRALIGSAILLTIVTAILIPQLMPVSGNSFVNAKLEWIRTPIEGDLAFSSINVGDKVAKGTVLGTVTNPRADDYFLNQLNSEISGLESALFSLNNRKKHLTERREILKVKVDDSLLSLQDKSQIRLEIVENELASAISEKAAIEKRIARYEKANANYKGEESYAVISRASIESLGDREKELQTSIISQTATINLLKSNLESALSGTFISENTPLEQQQLLEIEHSLANIDSEIESMTIRSNKLQAQIATRLERLKTNSYYELVAGVAGTMWDIGFPNGSYVNHGDSVVAIADTDTLSVEGNFHQRYLDNIKVGYPATISLMGSREKLGGVVTEVKIRDQIKSADLSAFNLDSPATNEFKVVVKLDDRQNNDLYIGQRAKVIISKSRSSIIPSLLLFFR